MRKLRLDPENLVVEGFTTSARMAGRGTIRGHDSYPSASTCPSANCPQWTDGCENPGPQTGFDIQSATGCNNCVCPNQVGGN
ncbi:MAG TPA: hypothetical protein VFQ39_13040 [Longimicrobium sp.]|nr:hypothetical protein [Longimicrobium sp.]